MCSNSTVLISVIQTISIIQTRIQTPMAKEVRIIEVPLYSTFNLIWQVSKPNCHIIQLTRPFPVACAVLRRVGSGYARLDTCRLRF